MFLTLLQGGGGPGGGWFNPALIKGLMVALFFGFSAITWVVKQIKAQAEIKRIQAERVRRRDEALRLGRAEPGSAEPSVQTFAPPPTAAAPTAPISHDDARRRLQELAERRRAALAEIARRAQSSRSAPTRPVPSTPRATPAPPRMAAPMQARPAAPAPRPQARPFQPAPQAQQQPMIRRTQMSEAQIAEMRRKAVAAEKAREAAARAEDRLELSEVAHMKHPSPQRDKKKPKQRTPDPEPVVAAPVQVPTALTAAGMPNMLNLPPASSSPAAAMEWRRAMAMLEILSPAVSMRQSSSPSLLAPSSM